MKTRAGRIETYIGFAILLVLTAIGAGVFVKQFHYDPSIFSAPVLKEAALAEAPSHSPQSKLQDVELSALLPVELKPMAPPEVFGPPTLSDKIDGKAELYLSAGFLRLLSQRFAAKDNSGSWMEVYVYEMGNARNAFAVYSSQKRSDVESIDFARFAYRTENALFFVHGSKYLELVASDSSGEMAEAMSFFARQFIHKRPEGAEAEDLNETALFPEEHLDEGSVTLLSSNVFGFSRLDNVYKAMYNLGPARMTAFLSLRRSSPAASDLLAAYHAFLIENGGSDVPMSVGIPGAVMVQVFDTYELVFVRGRLFAGVHEAESAASAEQLGLMLYQGLSDVPN